MDRCEGWNSAVIIQIWSDPWLCKWDAHPRIVDIECKENRINMHLECAINKMPRSLLNEKELFFVGVFFFNSRGKYYHKSIIEQMCRWLHIMFLIINQIGKMALHVLSKPFESFNLHFLARCRLELSLIRFLWLEMFKIKIRDVFSNFTSLR